MTNRYRYSLYILKLWAYSASPICVGTPSMFAPPLSPPPPPPPPHLSALRSTFWPFIYCMDQHLNLQDPQVAEQCAQSLSMKWDLMDDCYSGDLGRGLELMYANETASLEPPHQYTPWVTINGKVYLYAHVCVWVCM